MYIFINEVMGDIRKSTNWVTCHNRNLKTSPSRTKSWFDISLPLTNRIFLGTNNTIKTYSEGRIGIRMKNRKSTHCADKYTHWMCIMRYCLYNILQNEKTNTFSGSYKVDSMHNDWYNTLNIICSSQQKVHTVDEFL